MIPQHTAKVTVINTTNTWSSAPSQPGTEGPAISWSVRKSAGTSPNEATITISNLSPASVARITDTVRTPIVWSPAQLRELAAAGASTTATETVHTNAGIASVRLEVGYTDRPLWLWYAGQSTLIEGDRDTPETTVTLRCQDHGEAVGAGRISPPKTYTKGSKAVSLVVDLIHALGLDVDAAAVESAFTDAAARLGKVVTSTTTLLAPYTSAGAARAQLDQILGALDLSWMVLDGTFYLLKPSQTLPGYDPIVFKPSDGTLIDSPRRVTGGALEVDTVLRPGLIPARAARVQAAGIGSVAYRIREIESSGDTESGASVTCVLEELQTIPGVF